MQQVFFYKLKHVDNSTFVRCYRVVEGTVPCTTSSASIFAQLISNSNRSRLSASSPSKKHQSCPERYKEPSPVTSRHTPITSCHKTLSHESLDYILA